MIVEIGHFYTNETLDLNSLLYLREQNFNQDDDLVIFIDDYTCPSDNLDVEFLQKCCERMIGRKVRIEYESTMVGYFQKALKFLDPKKIQKISINDVPTELLYDGKRIFDFSTNRPSCQMLSFTWTLFRLNAFTDENENPSVLTVIDRKYFKLEQRVFSMIPLKFRDKIFYRYF